jgi:hypothetical protein
VEDATFFTVSDAGFFVGTLALLNSLRLSGNRGKLVVVDRGLTEEQRSRLEAAAAVVAPPDAVAGAHPLAGKPPADLLGASGIVVLIDSDMLVTRSLQAELDEARRGKLVVFPDHEVTRERRFEEWQALFELAAPPRAQRYVNAGFLAFSLDDWPGFLERWRRACERIPTAEIMRDPRSPFYASDQDALNAILMSEVAADRIAIRPEWHSVHPDGLIETEVVDERTLRCRLRGEETALLHFSLRPKVWQRRGAGRVHRDDAYLRLLPRVLFARDVAVRAQPRQVPIWARPRGRPFVHALHYLNRVRFLLGRKEVRLSAVRGGWLGSDE